MSIIGPRASEWDAVNTFLPDEIDKMKVRPGITGLSQYVNAINQLLSISLRKKMGKKNLERIKKYSI